MVTVKVKKNRGYTRGVALVSRDEDIPPCREDSPEGHSVDTGYIPEIGYFSKEGLETDRGNLVPFQFPWKPSERRHVPPGNNPDEGCWDAGTHLVFWDAEGVLIVDHASGLRYKVVCFEKQRSSKLFHLFYYTWYCTPEIDPCDEDYMEDISS